MPQGTKEQRTEYHREYRKKNRQKDRDRKCKWALENPEKIQAYNKKHRILKYGITEEEYNVMFLEQNGKCGICGTHQSKFKIGFAIDHCHETGKVRGLLCGNCNRAIGLLQDDIENLRCAILYLNKNLVEK